MTLDVELVLDLIAEDLPAAERQAQGMGLSLQRGEDERAFDFYIPYTAQDGQDYLIRLRCDGYDEQAPSFQFVNPQNPEEIAVLATWVIRSENRHYENGIPSLNCLQTKSGEGKIGSRHSILMHERRTSHVKGKRIL